MIHFHGGPIWPAAAALKTWKGRHAFISFWRPEQIALAASICQSFGIDNGAFSAWRAGQPICDWNAFYEFVAEWRRHPNFDFAIVPDVIGGTEAENDTLADQWQFPLHESAVVWHTNESVERLVRLATTWPRVCIGSSGAYDVSKPVAFLARMREVLPHIVDADGYPICKLHGLRLLNPVLYSQLPLASADSANVAINIGLDSAWRGTYQPASKELRAAILVERIEMLNGACRFPPVPQ